MALTFVLHEATRTGAPRLGGLIARELARDEAVRVIVMKDGPLTPWLRDVVGAENLVVRADDAFHTRFPFDDRLRLACQMMEGDPADLVYVNSLASSVFALAAALAKRKILVHVHEKRADMLNLLAQTVTKLEAMRVADAALLAADDIRGDLIDVFQTLPAEVENFGIAVDVEAIRRAADETPGARPLNALGRALQRGERVVVGMIGLASPRKGVDVFLETAVARPECDFLWIGGWRPQEAPDNIVYEAFRSLAAPNLYVTGPVDNPFPYMRMMDLFFLSSREDPNPLVLAEAMVLNLPILGFSQTTAIADRLGRAAILCHGAPNVVDAARVLAACSPAALRRPAFRAAGDAFVADYDLNEKMKMVRNLVARLRGGAKLRAPAAAAHAGGGVTRDLGQGVVELTFS